MYFRLFITLTCCWLLTLGMSACAVVAPTQKGFQPDGSITTSLRVVLVAQDMAATLGLVPELTPATTKISMSRPDTPFEAVLASELRKIGYQLDYSDAANAPNRVRYQSHRINDEGETTYEMSVSIGNFTASRNYCSSNIKI